MNVILTYIVVPLQFFWLPKVKLVVLESAFLMASIGLLFFYPRCPRALWSRRQCLPSNTHFQLCSAVTGARYQVDNNSHRYNITRCLD